jgi:hypothetical protein
MIDNKLSARLRETAVSKDRREKRTNPFFEFAILEKRDRNQVAVRALDRLVDTSNTSRPIPRATNLSCATGETKESAAILLPFESKANKGAYRQALQLLSALSTLGSSLTSEFVTDSRQWREPLEPVSTAEVDLCLRFPLTLTLRSVSASPSTFRCSLSLTEAEEGGRRGGGGGSGSRAPSR